MIMNNMYNVKWLCCRQGDILPETQPVPAPNIKGIKNGCPCIVEIRGTQGCALVGDPARAVGECRDVAKAQP